MCNMFYKLLLNNLDSRGCSIDCEKYDIEDESEYWLRIIHQEVLVTTQGSSYQFVYK